jgi:Fe/S biogenesis protein NfuA
MSDLQSVVVSQKKDGSWQAQHVPSGKMAHGLSKDEAYAEMRALLGKDESGTFQEPITSDRYTGIAKEIALFLEGPVSDMLAAHDGYARLEGYQNAVAQVRLGGGCQGCPASTMTLVQGVLQQLRETFGEEVIADIQPVDS